MCQFHAWHCAGCWGHLHPTPPAQFQGEQLMQGGVGCWMGLGSTAGWPCPGSGAGWGYKTLQNPCRAWPASGLLGGGVNITNLQGWGAGVPASGSVDPTRVYWPKQTCMDPAREAPRHQLLNTSSSSSLLGSGGHRILAVPVSFTRKCVILPVAARTDPRRRRPAFLFADLRYVQSESPSPHMYSSKTRGSMTSELERTPLCNPITLGREETRQKQAQRGLGCPARGQHGPGRARHPPAYPEFFPLHPVKRQSPRNLSLLSKGGKIVFTHLQRHRPPASGHAREKSSRVCEVEGLCGSGLDAPVASGQALTLLRAWTDLGCGVEQVDSESHGFAKYIPTY